MSIWRKTTLWALFLAINVVGFGALDRATLSGDDNLLLAFAVLIASVAVPAFLCRVWTTGSFVAVFVALAFALPVDAAERSRAVTQEFQRTHPCPSTGRKTGACPGYIKDHVIALACGGPDVASNMQWQTIEAGRAKDKWERNGCRKRR